MTDQERPASTPSPRATTPKRPAQTALPDDRRSRIWALAVPGIFALILVLALLGIPSRLFPQPTPEPLPTIPPAASPVSPAPTGSPGATGSPDASPSPSVPAGPTPSPSPVT